MKTALTLLAISLPLAAIAQTAVPPVPQVAVPVLKTPVRKGEVIQAENLMEQPIPASQVFASTLTSSAQLAGLQAVRPLPAGQPINKLHVRQMPDISRDSMVDLRFVRGAIQLTAKGQALEDGQIGQTIKVLNPVTRATLVGVVRAGGVVDVN